jgi:D-glycero-alpha-D-manno-heptose-7-phosphate kinase
LIIVQTPLRISFFGGGTDFPSFYREEGGSVLSSAIDKYIYVTIKQRFDDMLRVGYTKTELATNVDEIKHEIIRESFRLTGISKGVEITTMGDIPSGSGLGSSSTVAVGALHAMYVYQNQYITAESLAQNACEVEIDILKKPIGIQDQYIAAYGGLRFFEFMPDGTVKNELIELTQTTKTQLTENLLLFYTGITRHADSILTEQKEKIPNRLHILRELRKMSYTVRAELCASNLDSIGHLLHESWMLKKQLASNITNSFVEDMYEAARKAGALGGKLTGAGGGGFLLLYCPLESRSKVRKALENFREIPVRLEPDGSKVIFNYRR